MQVGGKKIVTRLSQRAALMRGGEKVEFTLTALPLGWEDQAERKLGQFPAPPRRVIQNADKTAVIDPTTRKAIVEDDYSDPVYRGKRDDYTNRMLVLKFRELVRLDPEVAFETAEPAAAANQAAWESYADALLAEVAEFMTKDELAQLCNLGEAIAVAVDLRKAVDDFLSPPAGTTGSQPTAS